MVECTKFVLGLTQFSDLLFALCSYFLSLSSLMGRRGACQHSTSLSRRSFRKQETVLRYGNSVKPRIFSSDHMLRSRERLLNRIVSKDLVSNSDLVVTLVHKYLLLENGLQVYSVNQVKMEFEGVRICKKRRYAPISNQTMETTTTPRVNPLLLLIPQLVPPPQLGKEGRRATPLTR